MVPVPILLVAGSYLGTISHTLSALAAMQSRDLAPHAVILNESPVSPVPLAETEATLVRHWPGLTIHCLKRNATAAEVASLAAAL